MNGVHTMQTLFDAFLAEEATAEISRLLGDAIGVANGLPNASDRRFEFNRFAVTLLFGEAMVLIEDDLDTSSDGSMLVSMTDFCRALDSIVDSKGRNVRVKGATNSSNGA
jgi:hypothetical protein